jgi:hypothetical protein
LTQKNGWKYTCWVNWGSRYTWTEVICMTIYFYIYNYIYTACVCVCMLYECNCIVFSVCVGMYRQIDVKSHTFSHVVPHLPWALSLTFIHR